MGLPLPLTVGLHSYRRPRRT